MTEIKKPIRHHKRPNMLRRLALSNILNRVALLNQASAIQQMAGFRVDLLDQMLLGVLIRLKKVNPFMLVIPPKVEAARLASAMKSTMGERK